MSQLNCGNLTDESCSIVHEYQVANGHEPVMCFSFREIAHEMHGVAEVLIEASIRGVPDQRITT